jgi:hypothetical protein
MNAVIISTPESKPAPPVEKLRVKVDGREVQVPKTMPDPVTGKPIPTTMIQACAMAKVDVPHYCYHRRELPDVPGGVWLAGVGAGSKADR